MSGVASSTDHVVGGLNSILDIASKGGLEGAKFDAQSNEISTQSSRVKCFFRRKFGFGAKNDNEKAASLLDHIVTSRDDLDEGHVQVIQRCASSLRGASCDTHEYLRGSHQLHSVEDTVKQALLEIEKKGCSVEKALTDTQRSQRIGQARNMRGQGFSHELLQETQLNRSESLELRKLSAFLETYPDHPLPELNDKTLKALEKCRHLENLSDTSIPQAKLRHVFSDSRVQKQLFTSEQKELLKDLSTISFSKSQNLYEGLKQAQKEGKLEEFISSLSKKDQQILGKVQHLSSKFEAILDRLAFLKKENLSHGFSHPKIAALMQLHLLSSEVQGENDGAGETIKGFGKVASDDPREYLKLERELLKELKSPVTSQAIKILTKYNKLKSGQAKENYIRSVGLDGIESLEHLSKFNAKVDKFLAAADEHKLKSKNLKKYQAVIGEIKDLLATESVQKVEEELKVARGSHKLGAAVLNHPAKDVLPKELRSETISKASTLKVKGLIEFVKTYPYEPLPQIDSQTADALSKLSYLSAAKRPGISDADQAVLFTDKRIQKFLMQHEEKKLYESLVVAGGIGLLNYTSVELFSEKEYKIHSKMAELKPQMEIIKRRNQVLVEQGLIGNYLNPALNELIRHFDELEEKMGNDLPFDTDERLSLIKSPSRMVGKGFSNLAIENYNLSKEDAFQLKKMNSFLQTFPMEDIPERDKFMEVLRKCRGVNTDSWDQDGITRLQFNEVFQDPRVQAISFQEEQKDLLDLFSKDDFRQAHKLFEGLTFAQKAGRLDAFISSLDKHQVDLLGKIKLEETKFEGALDRLAYLKKHNLHQGFDTQGLAILSHLHLLSLKLQSENPSFSQKVTGARDHLKTKQPSLLPEYKKLEREFLDELVDQGCSKALSVMMKFDKLASEEKASYLGQLTDEEKESLVKLNIKTGSIEKFHHRAQAIGSASPAIALYKKAVDDIHTLYTGSFAEELRQAVSRINEKQAKRDQHLDIKVLEITGKAFAPKDHQAPYILKPEALDLKELADFLSTFPDKSLKIRDEAQMEALKKCRSLNVSSWNQPELSFNEYAKIFCDKRVQKVLLEEEAKELLADVKSSVGKKLFKLDVNGSLRDKDVDVFAKLQRLNSKIKAFEDRKDFLTSNDALSGFDNPQLDAVIKKFHAIEERSNTDEAFKGRLDSAIARMDFKEAASQLKMGIQQLPKDRRAAFSEAFSKKGVNYTGLSNSVFVDMRMMTPLIKSYLSAKERCPDASLKHPFMDNLASSYTQIMAEYRGPEPYKDQDGIEAQATVTKEYEEKVSGALSAIENSIQTTLSCLPQERKEAVLELLGKKPIKLDGVSEDVLADCLLLRSQINDWKAVVAKHTALDGSFEMDHDKTNTVKHLKAFFVEFDGMDRKTKASVQKVLDEKKKVAEKRRVKIETVFNSRLLSQYIKTWFLPTQLAKLGVDQDIENVLIRGFENLEEALTSPEKLAKAFPKIIDGATEGMEALADDAFSERARKLINSQIFARGSWNTSEYGQQYCKQFTGPLLKVMFPDGVTATVKQEIENREVKGFRENLKKKSKLIGIDIFQQSFVKRQAQSALDVELGDDPIEGLIHKSLASLFTSIIDKVSDPDFINQYIVSGIAGYMNAATPDTSEISLAPAIPTASAHEKEPINKLIRSFLQIGFPNTGSLITRGIEKKLQASDQAVLFLKDKTSISSNSMTHLLELLRGTLYDEDSMDELEGGVIRSPLDAKMTKEDARDKLEGLINSNIQADQATWGTQWLWRGVGSFARSGATQTFDRVQDRKVNRFVVMKLLSSAMDGLGFYEEDPTLYRP